MLPVSRFAYDKTLVRRKSIVKRKDRFVLTKISRLELFFRSPPESIDSGGYLFAFPTLGFLKRSGLGTAEEHSYNGPEHWSRVMDAAIMHVLESVS